MAENRGRDNNDVNITYNVETQENQPQHEDSISYTRNEEATLFHGGQYPRRVREATPDDAEDEHVAETVRILREQQKDIMHHLSRQDDDIQIHY